MVWCVKDLKDELPAQRRLLPADVIQLCERPEIVLTLPFSEHVLIVSNYLASEVLDPRGDQFGAFVG